MSTKNPAAPAVQHNASSALRNNAARMMGSSSIKASMRRSSVCTCQSFTGAMLFQFVRPSYVHKSLPDDVPRRHGDDGEAKSYHSTISACYSRGVCTAASGLLCMCAHACVYICKQTCLSYLSVCTRVYVSYPAQTHTQTARFYPQRPSSGNVKYMPMPAPGSTIKVMQKDIRRRQTQDNILKEHEAALLADQMLLSVEHLDTRQVSQLMTKRLKSPLDGVRFFDSDKSTDGLKKNAHIRRGGGEGGKSGGRRRISQDISLETPRTRWRRQYWSKSTPFGTDRRTYSGMHFYDTCIKPVSRYYNKSSRWENASTIVPPVDSEVRQR